MKMKLLTIATLGATILSTGCATVTRGTTQNIAVDTNPQEATISSSSGPGCTSPCTLDLKRNTGHTITAKKAGYKPISAVVRNEVGGGGAAGFAGNIIIGGGIGMIVDATSGAMYDLHPAKLTMSLEKE